MAGLNLKTGFTAGGSYTPMTPASAAPSTAMSGLSIRQQAYGINGGGGDSGRAVAGYGSVGVGVLALAALTYLWWSLPR